MEVVFWSLVIAAIIVAVIALNHAQTSRRIEALRRLANRLEGGRLRLRPGTFRSLDEAAVDGVLNGRRVGLRLEVRGSGDSAVAWAIYTVHLPSPAPGFTLGKADMWTKLGRWLGVTSQVSTGRAVVDRQYVVRGLDPRSARRLFRSGELEAALGPVFGDLRGHTLALEGNTLRLERVAFRHSFEPGEHLRVFTALRRVARLCERVEIKVEPRIREAIKVSSPSYGWTGGGAEILCPYCRDAIDLAGEETRDCGECGTVHHRACLAEAGGCTLFGCRGAAPRRASLRRGAA